MMAVVAEIDGCGPSVGGGRLYGSLALSRGIMSWCPYFDPAVMLRQIVQRSPDVYKWPRN